MESVRLEYTRKGEGSDDYMWGEEGPRSLSVQKEWTFLNAGAPGGCEFSVRTAKKGGNKK